MTRRLPITNLGNDEKGATIVEFALVAPVLIVMLLGLFDMGYNTYTSAVLQGAIAKAARNSTIEGANPSKLDEAVTNAVHDIAPNATLTFTRKAYANFSDVATPEDFSDLNGDGVCDNGEPFEDVNGNKTWDKDRGKNGGGGARDAVVYTVDVSYPRIVPIATFIGGSSVHEVESSTVLRNQPWDKQDTTTTVQHC